jgi:thiamine-phosphate pyrophosphorylase
MKIRPPKLYVIADRGIFRSNEEWLGATRVVAGHLSKIEGSALQIRVKGSSPESRSNLLYQAREVVDEAMTAGLDVLANTTLDEALALEFSGVHFSEHNTPSKPVPTQSIPTHFLMGASTHNEASIQKATMAGAHFILLSPIFAPLSKQGTGMGLKQFSELSKQSHLPVLALGGIIPQRVSSCMQAGAAGVAMISSVMKTPTPKRVLKSIHKELMKHSNGNKP